MTSTGWCLRSLAGFCLHARGEAAQGAVTIRRFITQVLNTVLCTAEQEAQCAASARVAEAVGTDDAETPTQGCCLGQVEA